ncbi:MAG: S41 family peptidase [Bacteroidales bacterium]|jgi:carboxyl-terminal processing protease|nr:S41 family peptidase [Bacteroidales bacterium]MDD2263767.1 S41 family peptidase [Bacteroidales bacterium]MDD2831015.1 S41 family peptidase [Bacteroidales bacterium]MDD3208177.1 S41 family peptidase [Bacteroidales bacterium]MDD3696781.1 S41 family peptidase [Bacteroidales bacterium]
MKKIVKRSLIFVLLILSLINSQPIKAQGSLPGLNDQVNKLGQVLFLIHQYYLDTINTGLAVDEMVRTLVDQLDPHSAYIPAEDVRGMNEPLEGNFEGIGIEFAIIHDSLVVITPIAGAPSENVGIRADDRIVAVDGVEISSSELTNQRVFSLLRGPKGTRVSLTVVRRGEDNPLYFEVIRDKIPIHSVDAAYMAAPGVMYIKLNKFALTTQDEFIEAFRDLKEMPGGLILDLQGNGGGYLGAALFLAEQFLGKGELILYTEGRKIKRQEVTASGMGFFTNTPVVVIMDERSASASEIVAGAIQDWDRGVIVGRRSFGKGLVQQPFPLNDGSELRLTVARYHTPSGRLIQSPYVMGEKELYYREFLERYERGESFSKDSVLIPDSLAYRTLRKNRIVYGGGGIMPDVFVPADTTYYSAFYVQLARRGIITEFINDYLDSERERLLGMYSDFESFNKRMIPENVPFNQLIDLAATFGIVPREEELEISGKHIRLQIKALIAARLYGTGSFYRVINPVLPEYKKALEVMNGLL